MPKSSGRQFERKPFVILVLQGGGARGAYQVGVWRALSEAGLEPDWVCGISSGALNAAVIAGNDPADREEAIAGFWRSISAPIDMGAGFPEPMASKLRSMAAMTALIHHRNFHRLRTMPKFLAKPGSPAATSLYDNAPLIRNLRRFIDFDGYNALPQDEKTRLCLGVVDVESAELEFFDSKTTDITPYHVLASGALPNGAAGVEIDGRLYWDGGVVANSPVTPILEGMLQGETNRRPTLTIVVDLWSGGSERPMTMEDVDLRKLEVTYMSKMKASLDHFQDKLNLAACRWYLEENGLEVPFRQAGTEPLAVKRFAILHVIHGRGAEGPLGPMDFSAGSIKRRGEAGLRDTRAALEKSEWRRWMGRSITATVQSFRDGEPVTSVRELELPLAVWLRAKYERLVAEATARAKKRGTSVESELPMWLRQIEDVQQILAESEVWKKPPGE